MTNVSDIETARNAIAGSRERRRSGRPAHVSAELLPLLRGQEKIGGMEVPDQFGDPDQLRGVRGLAVGTACSAVLWAGIIYVGHWILS
jgi:hypothetical protein